MGGLQACLRNQFGVKAYRSGLLFLTRPLSSNPQQPQCLAPRFKSPFLLAAPLSDSFPVCMKMEQGSDDSRIHPSIYPQARREESIVEDFHGIRKVADPYRWLEDPDSTETKAFVDELNKISEPYLKGSSLRSVVEAKLTALWNYEKFSNTSVHGPYFYYSHNTGLQNQFVVYQQQSLEDLPGKVFIDPNTLSEDGTTSISSSAWAVDGSLWAYCLSEKGSDWMTARFKRSDGTDLPDVVPNIKHSGMSWLGDNSGIFYARYPESTKPKDATTTTEKDKYHSLYFHKLGTNAEDDVLVADFRENEDFMVDGSVTLDGCYLIVEVNKGCDPTNQVFFHDLRASGNTIKGRLELSPLFTQFDAKYSVIDTDAESGTALVLTNRDAPMFKLLRVPMREHKEDEWEVLIDEDPKRKLSWAGMSFGGRLLVGYLEDVKDVVYVHEASTGRLLYQLATPMGALGGLYCRKDVPLVFFSYDSMISPTTVYKADFGSCTSLDDEVRVEKLRSVRVEGLDAEKEFEVEQVFYPSRDGTRIPMYIQRLKGVPLDGSAPTMLYGYGGFNISLMPNFSIVRSLFIKHFGGIYAQANLRGGDEYGERWHEAGMKGNKQNVFDDFIAAGEYLVREGYTKPERLCIRGGSNGGLLVAACSQQRPDLFGAVVNHVGVLDMLRFHKFTIGGAWLPEFGDPSKSEDFSHIYAYSPLHQLRLVEGVEWPATLLLTADHDDRVVPAHTLKYIAQLYQLLKMERGDEKEYQPAVLAKVEVSAGHGAGKPTSKMIAEQVDVYCFLQRVFDLKWKD